MPQKDINAKFSNLIREEMTNKQFWKWVSSWLDQEEICNQAEAWDIKDKIEILNQFKK